jgi:hypothetical protein
MLVVCPLCLIGYSIPIGACDIVYMVWVYSEQYMERERVDLEIYGGMITTCICNRVRLPRHTLGPSLRFLLD